MLCVFIVSTRKDFLDAVTDSLASRAEIDARNICNVHLPAAADAVHGFRFAEERMADFLRQKDLVHDRFVGILQVNQTYAGDIRPLGTSQGALILAFPEIQWIPVYGPWRPARGDTVGSMTWIRAIELCNNGYSPLFDGDGLRSCLMMKLRKGYARADVALAVDEETSFAQMNAYTAYRFGYRAYPVPSKTVAEVLLRVHPRDLPVAETLMGVELGHLEDFRKILSAPRAVVFEDVQLQFSDGQGTEKAPKFGTSRDTTWPLLNEADLRVVATAARQGEKLAEKENGDRETAEEHFRGKNNGRQGEYISLQGGGLRGWALECVRHLNERLARMWFNMGGDWAGHWLVNAGDAILMAGVLIGVFFWKVSLVLPTLFGVFVVRGLLRHGLQKASEKKGYLPERMRMYLVRRAQWRFLPKRYRNHCPEKRIGAGADTYWTVIHKPLAGIFGLRNECCLPNGQGYQGLYDTSRVLEQYRLAKQGDFGEPTTSANDGEEILHAAPGMALEIAVRLLRRAERLQVEDKIIDAEGAIHGAVLATVAGELLDAKTPAVSIEALTWKQYFEIRAECEFVGVQAHPDMADRFVDIHNAMRRICRSADGTVREDVYTSGMAELMDKLAALLSEKGKRDEALYFVRKARLFHRRLMKPIARNFLAYPEWVLRSPWHFAISFAAVAAVFCIYWMVREQTTPDFLNAIAKTYEALVCDEPNLDAKNPVVIHTMRQMSLLHVAFLAASFWDAMHRR